jgi:hypothetical protein
MNLIIIPAEILQGVKWCMIIFCIGFTLVWVVKSFVKMLLSPKIESWFDKLKGVGHGG